MTELSVILRMGNPCAPLERNQFLMSNRDRGDRFGFDGEFFSNWEMLNASYQRRGELEFHDTVNPNFSTQKKHSREGRKGVNTSMRLMHQQKRERALAKKVERVKSGMPNSFSDLHEDRKTSK